MLFGFKGHSLKVSAQNFRRAPLSLLPLLGESSGGVGIKESERDYEEFTRNEREQSAMERHCCELSGAISRASGLANRQYIWFLFRAVVAHLFEPASFVVAGSSAGDFGWGICRPHFYHFSRLRAWIVFQIAPSQ